MNSTEDLINALTDTLDILTDLATVSTTSTQQQALRVNAGRLIATLREQLDDLDYAYTLFVCELSPVRAEHYRQMYLSAVREHVEVQA